MAQANVQIRTSLSIRDCAALFQESMKVSKLSGWKGQGTEFGKPPVDEAFGDLDEDPPTFSVMAVIGGGGSDWQKSAVRMYAWDRGEATEIEITTGRALLSLGVKAKGKIMRFVQALQASDPSVQYSGL